MRKSFRNLLTTTAVLAALAGGSTLYAYADTPNSPRSGGMMQGTQGDMTNMMGMMNMMGQMSQMMETCNHMMKEMPKGEHKEMPKDEHKEMPKDEPKDGR